jgi:BirA family biotin operon repressor/biotin-[acetyl-CoA-carboxylase] ligase
MMKKINPSIIYSHYDLPYPITILYQEIVESTQTHIKKNIEIQHGITAALFCEQQTKGIGRLNRLWNSPYGENIYGSLIITLPCHISDLSGLSLVAGLAIAKALAVYSNTKLQIKWPNDILANNQKLGGILIDIHKIMPNKTTLIIGFGVNVFGKNYTNVTTPHTSLSQVSTSDIHCPTSSNWDRNIIIADILTHLMPTLFDFAQKGFRHYQTEFMQNAAYLGEMIQVKTPTQIYKGIFKSITNTGSIIIETTSGMVELSMGDVAAI